MVIYIGLLNGKLRGAFVLLRSLQNTAVVMLSSKIYLTYPRQARLKVRINMHVFYAY